MPLEIAIITIRAGHEDAFADAMSQRGMPILRETPGVRSARCGRGVENPEKFTILVDWDSMEAHAAFRTLPVCPEFDQLFAPHAAGGTMEHFEIA